MDTELHKEPEKGLLYTYSPAFFLNFCICTFIFMDLQNKRRNYLECRVIRTGMKEE
jgi:hypothetical protein